MIEVLREASPRLCQGDILRDVEHIEFIKEQAGIVEVSKIVYPLVIVLTQDCDLEQDYKLRSAEKPKPNQDKCLLSVLVAPVYNYEHVIAGTHLQDLKLAMRQINAAKSEGQNLRNNETPRYHYLSFRDDVPITPSVIDFKHFLSVNLSYLNEIRERHFVRRVADLFREDISLRFANFLCRIGLPVPE